MGANFREGLEGMDKDVYRFNLKVPHEYKLYLQETAWQNRTTITDYLKKLIAEDMEKHPNWRDTLDEANE
jgi:hypothetical protein